MIKKLFILLAAILISISCTNSESERTSNHIYTPYHSSMFNKNDLGQDCDIVYVTRYGKCFHRDDCYTIRHRDTRGIDRHDAKSKGKRPCKKCSP